MSKEKKGIYLPSMTFSEPGTSNPSDRYSKLDKLEAEFLRTLRHLPKEVRSKDFQQRRLNDYVVGFAEMAQQHADQEVKSFAEKIKNDAKKAIKIVQKDSLYEVGDEGQYLHLIGIIDSYLEKRNHG